MISKGGVKMVKRNDLKDSLEYRDRVVANNKRLVRNYFIYLLGWIILLSIGLVGEYLGFEDFQGLFDLLPWVFVIWFCLTVCYVLYALFVPYSIRDYFFIEKKYVANDEAPDICKLKDMDSQKWVKVSEKKLLDAVPLNTTVTMILKGRTIVDFYKESYEPTPIISSYSKTEKTLVSRKEISYDEFQEYMKNFEENDRENK